MIGQDVNIMAPAASAGASSDYGKPPTVERRGSPRVVLPFVPAHVHIPIRKDKGLPVCAACLRRIQE